MIDHLRAFSDWWTYHPHAAISLTVWACFLLLMAYFVKTELAPLLVMWRK